MFDASSRYHGCASCAGGHGLRVCRELVGQCAPNPTTQRFEIDANGTVTVRKFAHWIRRAVDGKIWLDGQRVH